MKKLLNGIAGALCVMAVCVFAGCSSPSGGAEPAPAQQGDIVYSDGTWSADYNSSKTAVGIVLIPDTVLGIPYKIVGLESGSNIKWVLSTSVNGYTCKIETSSSDGKDNWSTFSQAANDGAISNYPAFDYCNSKNSEESPWFWYLPAVDELAAVLSMRDVINSGIKKITSGNPQEIPDSGIFWSSTHPLISSQYLASNNVVTVYLFGSGDKANQEKDNLNYVLPIAIYKQSSN